MSPPARQATLPGAAPAGSRPEVRSGVSILDLPGFDSIAAVEVLERLETELDVEVPPELIVPEAFESLDSLAELFARPLQEVDA